MSPLALFVNLLAGLTYTDSDLAAHDTDDLKVGNRSDPVNAAYTIRSLAAPTVLPAIGLGEITAQVADGEQDVTLETKTGTG